MAREHAHWERAVGSALDHGPRGLIPMSTLNVAVVSVMRSSLRAWVLDDDLSHHLRRNQMLCLWYLLSHDGYDAGRSPSAADGDTGVVGMSPRAGVRFPYFH